MLQYSVNSSSLLKDAFDNLGQKQVVLIHCKIIAGKPKDIIIYHYIIAYQNITFCGYNWNVIAMK